MLNLLIILIFVASQIGFLLILKRQQRLLECTWQLLLRHDEYAVTQDVNFAALEIQLENAIKDDGQKTRKDLQEVKTRMADEERTDQTKKRQERAKRATK